MFINNNVKYDSVFDTYFEENKGTILQDNTDINQEILENIRRNIIDKKNIRKIQEDIFFTILINDTQKPISDGLKNIFKKNIWKIKNGLIDNYIEDYENKGIDNYIHKIIEKTKTKTETETQKINIGSKVQWYDKDKLLTGVVEKITTKSYRVCCKPNKKSGDTSSLYTIPQINKEYPERQIKLMVETDKNIIDKYLKNMTENMLSKK